MGLVALPAALGEHVDTSLLTLGACGVSLGSMIAAGGVLSESTGDGGAGRPSSVLGRIQAIAATSPGWLRCLPRRPASNPLQSASSPPLS